MACLKKEFLLRIFFRYMDWLCFAPNPDANNVFYSIKAGVCFLVATCLFTLSFYHRFVISAEVLTATSFFSLLDAARCILVLQILVAYRKCDNWRDLYKTLDIAGKPTKGIVRLILIFFAYSLLTSAAMPLHSYITYLTEEEVLAMISGFCMFWLPAYYLTSLSVLITLIILRTRAQLIRVKLDLQAKPVNLKSARLTLLKISAGVKHFNHLFGYELLTIFGQWILHLIVVYTNLLLLVKSKQVDSVDLISWDIVVGGVCTITLASVGPCVITFACSKIRSEKENILITCYDRQEEFDWRSFEYQELESLASYTGSGMIRFSAAEFFEIKGTVLLSVIVTSTTYFVALVQFF